MRNPEYTLSRRKFLQLATSTAAIAGVAKNMPAHAAESERASSVTREGTLTVYNSDTLMDKVLANRYGLHQDLFFRQDIREEINATTHVDALRRITGLVTNEKQFNHLLERMNEHTFLYLLQAVTNPSITRPYFIAPDTYNYYQSNAEAFVGTIAQLRASQTLDSYGNLVDHAKPRAYAVWIMDVRAKVHHDNYPTMLSDADPSTISRILNAHWDKSEAVFRSENGQVVRKLPKVQLEIFKT